MHKRKTDHVCGGNKQTQWGGGGVSESRRAGARMRETRMSGNNGLRRGARSKSDWRSLETAWSIQRARRHTSAQQ